MNELINKFSIGDEVVYPSHGVGEIVGIECQAIGGLEIKVFVIYLSEKKMTLRVPIKRASAVGLRPLCTNDIIQQVVYILQTKPKITRGMWSRRVQEYESKINSGDLLLIAEVVRDLHRNVDDPDRSYSERVIYESALERLIREISAVQAIDHIAANELILETINEKYVAA